MGGSLGASFQTCNLKAAFCYALLSYRGIGLLGVSSMVYSQALEIRSFCRSPGQKPFVTQQKGKNVYKQFGHFIKVGCDKTDTTIDCYTHNVYGKLSPGAPGAWYSSLQKGYCGNHPLGYSNCTWRVVSVDKIVKRECHTQVFGSAVAATAPECFTRCGNQ